jgi:spore germination protein GerM
MKTRISSALLIVLFLSACNGTFEVGLEYLPTAIPTQPAVVATDMPLIQPTPEVTVQTEVSLPPGGTSTQFVQIFLIAIDDNGQGGLPIGCGDSIIPVQVEIPTTQGVLKAALESLLSVKTQFYGESGLYNALYQSDLQVESVSIVDGIATVNLTGRLLMGGECDNPRIQAQLEQTVLQFPTVTKAEIFINGKTLADALSLKG